MSGLRKRLQRRMLTTLARAQRKETAGHGPKVRRPVASWVKTTKFDLTITVLEQRLAAAKAAEGTNGMTAE